MSDLKKVLLPMIKRILPGNKEPIIEIVEEDYRKEEVAEHHKKAKQMSVEELEKQRVYYFDLWCWETGDPTHRMISNVYEGHLKSRGMITSLVDDLIGVQPMPGPVGQVMTLRYRYGEGSEDTEEDDT
jgi:hypothetical protein